MGAISQLENIRASLSTVIKGEFVKANERKESKIRERDKQQESMLEIQKKKLMERQRMEQLEFNKNLLNEGVVGYIN